MTPGNPFPDYIPLRPHGPPPVPVSAPVPVPAEPEPEPAQVEPLPVPAPVPQPQAEDRNGIDPGFVPPGVVQQEAQHFLFQWLQTQGPHRGIFTVEKDPANQMFPGVSLPPWLITLLNQISGHPALGYNYDRTTMHRDLLFLAVAAVIQTLQQYDHSDEQEQAVHIIRAQNALRQELFVEELMLNYVEDLAVAAGLLSLKLSAHSMHAVYEQLRKLFHHIEQTQDQEFWRPLLIKLTLNVPEIRQALQVLSESDFYRYDRDYQAWLAIFHTHQEREREEQP